MNGIADWFKRQLANPQVVILATLLLSISAVIFFAGSYLAPAFAALVIAYLLQGLVSRLTKLRVPHLAAVCIVFVSFFTALLAVVLVLMPLLTQQMTQLFQQVPSMLSKAQELLLTLPQKYPNLISEETAKGFVTTLQDQIISWSQGLLGYSVASVVTIIYVGIYLILVPLLVFFMIRDKDRILGWFGGFLPANRALATEVWTEVDDQIGNYARGKVWEILIVGSVSYTVYAILGLQYAVLLGALTGVSVLVPYVGAAVVGIPVALVAFFQWGVSTELWIAIVAYGVIQALDGNLLAPLLFSEAVNLHPVAIIVAILFFGGLWGFWGVFFAIPLATVIKAVLRAWPRAEAVAESQ